MSICDLSSLADYFPLQSPEFEIYSEYCNNHPTSCEELRQVARNKKYQHFFEVGGTAIGTIFIIKCLKRMTDFNLVTSLYMYSFT